MGTVADRGHVSAAPNVFRGFSRSGAPTLILFAAVASALIVASVMRAPLSWDGSFYLFQVLDRQSWFIAQPHRWINYALQAPTIVALHLTSNLDILTLIFSLSYASVAMVGLTISWLVCRKRPDLFIWPAIGIGLATLPGIINFNSEATMTAPLFWPVLLATLVGVDLVESLLVALLALAMLIVHPNAASVLALGAITACVSAMLPPFKPMRLAGSAALVALTVVRLIIPLTPYEHQQLIGFNLNKAFVWGLEGWPLVALGLIFLLAACCLYQRLNCKTASRWVDFAPTVAVTAVGLVLIPWASNPAAWANEMEFRFWMVPMSLPIMGACALDTWLASGQVSLGRRRQPALVAIGAVFLIVVSIQSVIWNQLTNRLLADIEGEGCMSLTSLPWTTQTLMHHWSTASYAIVLQGRTPHRLVLDAGGCLEYATDATVHIIWMRRKNGSGWFDLGQVPVDSWHSPWTR
jgi:hypothetical protein